MYTNDFFKQSSLKDVARWDSQIWYIWRNGQKEMELKWGFYVSSLQQRIVTHTFFFLIIIFSLLHWKYDDLVKFLLKFTVYSEREVIVLIKKCLKLKQTPDFNIYLGTNLFPRDLKEIPNLQSCLLEDCVKGLDWNVVGICDPLNDSTLP